MTETAFRADLHCHTTCSDGTVTPTDIITLAIESHLSGLSITDHDTVDAYQEALPIAKQNQFPLVSGVEFSAMHKETSVHILAYSFSLQSEMIQNLCLKHKQRRIERNHLIIERLGKAGMPLQNEDICELESDFHSSVGRPHIAAAMVKRGYVESIQQAFNLYLGEGKPCYAAGRSFSVEETVDIIHQAKGLAVIAHPHLIENVKTLRDLLDMEFDGIEGYYARFPPQAHERWIKIGKRKEWIITGGSDFHGQIKPNLPLGCSWIGKETFSILLEHFKKNSKDDKFR
jgi:3',5'-nucleoside bisphosphate phosphatase